MRLQDGGVRDGPNGKVIDLRFLHGGRHLDFLFLGVLPHQKAFLVEAHQRGTIELATILRSFLQRLHDSGLRVGQFAVAKLGTFERHQLHRNLARLAPLDPLHDLLCAVA